MIREREAEGSPAIFPEGLPLGARARLIAAVSGRDHLLGAAREIFAQAGKGGPQAAPLARMAGHLSIAALEADPLSGPLARFTLAAATGVRILDQAQAAPLARLAKAWEEPPEAALLAEVAGQGDARETQNFIAGQAHRAPGKLYWRRQLVHAALAAGDYQAADAELADAFHDPWRPLADRLRADAALARGEARLAAGLYRRAVEELPWLQARLGLARALLLDGGKERAVAELAGVVQEFPWHTTALLLLHDLAGGGPSRGKLTGPVAACLYSFNGAGVIDQTLAALAASEPGPELILALDNGSSDGTAEILRAWEERMGSDRFRAVILPVNVGAPAARNWLATRPEIREMRYVLFLDDDALVPPDWRGLMGASVAAYPGAAVHGCKVADEGNPARLQSIDLHVMPVAKGSGDAPGIDIASAHLEELELGRYDYQRPCASVTGCCHLFAADALLDGPAFDIRFSPSQFDDLDRDLTLCRGGGYAAYQGHLKVLHKKSTGGLAILPGQGYASGRANRFKLTAKHGSDGLNAVSRHALAIALADLECKTRKVSRLLKP